MVSGGVAGQRGRIAESAAGRRGHRAPETVRCLRRGQVFFYGAVARRRVARLQAVWRVARRRITGGDIRAPGGQAHRDAIPGYRNVHPPPHVLVCHGWVISAVFFFASLLAVNGDREGLWCVLAQSPDPQRAHGPPPGGGVNQGQSTKPQSLPL